MAVVVLAILFWLRLPDVSRTYLLILFPAQFLVTLATRAVLRFGFRNMRSQGLNKRFVLVVGSDDRALAFATKLESHRELGLEVIGFLDDDPDAPWDAGRRLGRFEDLERVLLSRVIDEVAICLPFSAWDLVTPMVAVAEDLGKIVRVPIDLLDRSFTSGKVEELDGTPVYSLVSGPDRMLGLAMKQVVDFLGAAVLLVLAQPRARRGCHRHPGDRRLADPVPAGSRGPCTAAGSRSSSSER